MGKASGRRHDASCPFRTPHTVLRTLPMTTPAALHKDLAQTIPAEIWEVLAPAITWRSAPGRLIAVLPNEIWSNIFATHAAGPARERLQAAGQELAVVCRAEAVGAASGGDQRFTSFLEDPGNLLALAACRRVVEAPGLEHNPLYLHGPPGCGKTHLVTAIAHAYRGATGDQAVMTWSGASFVATEALQLAERGDTAIRRRLEGAALIAVDDVQALAGRALAQEEMFHLINACLDRGQQLVFTGPVAPRKLDGIEDRLATRLGWGLVVGLDAPHLETRLALVRRLAGAACEHLAPDEMVRLVDTLAPDMHQAVRLAQRLIDGERPGIGADEASFDRILEAVAIRLGLRPADIAGKRRHREVTRARQLALLLGRRLTTHSLEALGGMVGGRDHSTALYSIREAERRVTTDRSYAALVQELTREVMG